MQDEFDDSAHSPAHSTWRSFGGSWHAYDLWRITIEVPRKVQLIVTHDDDDDPRNARRKTKIFVAKIAGAITLLLLLIAAFVADNSYAQPLAVTASSHSEISSQSTQT